MSGFLNENLIKAKLAKRCDIKEDPIYDHKYKLDFVIDRFKDIDKLVHIGVQVTINPNDSSKQAEFLRERKKASLVDRSLYVKVHPSADIDHWGAELIYTAITAFAFQKDLRSKDVLGVHINQNVTYEFFELAEQSEHPSAQTAGRTLYGKMTAYNKQKGFGFIEADSGGKWFFHFSSIKDDELRDNTLPNAAVNPDTIGLEKPISVEFQDGGFTREDALAPSALNIKPVRTGNY